MMFYFVSSNSPSCGLGACLLWQYLNFLLSSSLFPILSILLNMGLSFATIRIKKFIIYRHKNVKMRIFLSLRKSGYFLSSEITPICTQSRCHIIWGNSRRWEHNSLYHGSTSSILLIIFFYSFTLILFKKCILDIFPVTFFWGLAKCTLKKIELNLSAPPVW